MQEPKTYINTDIDYERDGKQVSYLRLPYSRNTSAWGIIPIPIAVVRNGVGPTVLLTAGNHGDEYEGQITLNNLIRTLEPGHIQGRVIILPALNFPAAMAGRRVSPLDGLNLNRVFPGDPDGTPTRQIADYVTNVILPMIDGFLDLHSGGYSMDFIHTAILYRQNTPALMQRAIEAARAWGFPFCLVLDDLGERRTIDALCRDRGLLKRLHQPAPIMRVTEIVGPESYLFATSSAIFEPNFHLGSEVSKGEIAGWFHYIDEITRDPSPLRFATNGIVAGCRAPGRVAAGDLVAVVVCDMRS